MSQIYVIRDVRKGLGGGYKVKQGTKKTGVFRNDDKKTSEKSKLLFFPREEREINEETAWENIAYARKKKKG